MDPEPDRCRRTDGKKWRCGKIAVPNQKYCDRHMHRGRQGSRKRVERDNQSASEPDRRISTVNRMPNSSSVASEYRDGIVRVSAQNNLGQSHPDRKRGNHQVEEGKECSFQNADPKKINHHTAEKVNHPRFISPGFGSSPKSVLYCGAGKVELSMGPKNVIESIPQRCRRTDGKKWQCSRDALPSQKYCQSHMHRGAKRVTFNPQYAITFPGPSACRKGRPSSTLSRSLDNSINLNAIPKSPQHVSDNNSTSSASDATTITDENISFSLAQSLNNC